MDFSNSLHKKDRATFLALFLVIVGFLWVSRICGTCDENVMVCFCWHLELGICLLMGCCYFYNAYPGGRKRLCCAFLNICTCIYQGYINDLKSYNLGANVGQLVFLFSFSCLYLRTHYICVCIHITNFSASCLLENSSQLCDNLGMGLY